jgi:hypothetical protein
MAVWKRRIDPDNAPGTHFTSANLFENSYGDIPNTGDCVNEKLAAYGECFSSKGGDDTTAVNFAGWNATNAEYPIILAAPETIYHRGLWLPGRNHYRISGTNYPVTITAESVFLRRIAINANVDPITHDGDQPHSEVHTVEIDSCLLFAGGIGLFSSNSDSVTFLIRNNFIKCDEEGIFSITDYSTNVYMYNNTIVTPYSEGIAMYTDTTSYIINNIVFGTSGPSIYATYAPVKHHNAVSVTGGDEGSSPVDLSSYSGSDIFVDYAGDDFHLLKTSPVFGQGYSLRGDGVLPVTRDIDRHVIQHFSIGADDGPVLPGLRLGRGMRIRNAGSGKGLRIVTG